MRTSSPELTPRQRSLLRARAQRLKPVVWVGDGGVSPGVLRALDQALAAHELVKVRMRAPADKRAWAQALARDSGAALCAVVGHTAVLYRPDPESPRIDLTAALPQPPLEPRR